MAIRNLMEDAVASVVMEVLAKEGKDMSHPDVYYDDIIAYVLNRVPAKYITSERGILHDRIDSRMAVQQRSDILFLTHEAIDFIKNRRAAGTQTGYGDLSKKSFFFQHIIGEVLEETSFNHVDGVQVTLLHDGNPAVMIDQTWKNPYITKKATRGFYHFWPDFIEGAMKKEGAADFVVRFDHPKLKRHEVAVKMDVAEKFNLNNSHVIPITLLQTREGVDVSFLYEQE